MSEPQITHDLSGARFYVLQDPTATRPYAVCALPPGGLPLRWVPGKGWLDWPALVGAMFGFGDRDTQRELREVTWEDASTFIVEGVGALPESMIEEMRTADYDDYHGFAAGGGRDGTG